MSSTHCEVLVVGGGITGCSTTWHLAGAGADVVLLEVFDLNTQASGRNAGSLHGQIQHAPFVQRGAEWARDFLPALRFLVASLEIWKDLDKTLESDLETSLNGGLLIAETSTQMRDIERKVAIERSWGVQSEILGPEDLQRMAPYVSESMVGAQFCLLEGKTNPLLVAPAFARAAAARGARVKTNTEVLGLEWEAGLFKAITNTGRITANRVVLAAGNSLNRFSSLWGRPLPIVEEPIQLGATEPLAPMVHNLVYFAGDKLTLKQAKAGSLLIGGGWEADFDAKTGQPRVNHQSLSRNLSVALRVVPSLRGVKLIRTWAGRGLGTPDLRPIVGYLGPPGLVIGVYPHMGLTAGPLLGRVLSQLALERQPEVDLVPFAADRF